MNGYRRTTPRFLLALAVAGVLLITCSDPPNDPVDGDRVKAINGSIYRQDVGETGVSPQLQFVVTDRNDKNLIGAWIHFTLMEGDGLLSDDSARTDGNGIATLDYTFSDSLGHAVIQADAPAKEAVQVTLRSSRLVFGAEGQGQYVLLSDNYGVVKALNGEPERIDVDPSFYILVAVYEETLGAVFVIEDVDSNEVAGDDEPIILIIVNDNEDADHANNYLGTTREGIGIGSSIAEAGTWYGAPFKETAIFGDSTYWRYIWPGRGFTALASYLPLPEDQDIREIHIEAPFVYQP